MDPKLRFAVVGATGTVGRELMSALFDADVEPEQVTAFVSDRSEGEEIEYGEETLEGEKTDPESFRGMSVVFLAVPADAAKTLGPKAQQHGAWVIDLSAAHLSDEKVPVIVPAVNVEALKKPFTGRIVRMPSPLVSALLTTLEPLRARFGVRRVFVTALVAASSEGKRGVAELEKQVAALLAGRENEPEVFPYRLGFNVVPQVGPFSGERTVEERGWMTEARRIWAGKGEAPVISGTAIQIPTFFGHALSITVELAQQPSEADVRAALKSSSALKVLDSPEERIYPMPMLVTADPTVHVGRVRGVEGSPGFFELFATIDNAGRGAALNALDVARALTAGA